MKTRREICHEEMTRDPIFLLQIKNDRRAPWRTETVFFTREEGEEWAKARSYRWKFWQIYCMAATGKLAEILRSTDDEPATGRTSD